MAIQTRRGRSTTHGAGGCRSATREVTLCYWSNSPGPLTCPGVVSGSGADWRTMTRTTSRVAHDVPLEQPNRDIARHSRRQRAPTARAGRSLLAGEAERPQPVSGQPDGAHRDDEGRD